ncbi:hypothetical protein VB780_12820 [Leptolyngbya sp. CCNP1308]|uniref:hypothetical protein n=1 Tax=Leptolyngbya sp. CCNP1308 TaxID=3110255 RepID=UPI002B210C8F|nr:hypothetical protein [Leptolyngbya sp. CCNP1308]MEA5449459.1 hypothetical protein [Leptolyngbya sp. CCNP1308]
MPMDRKLYPPNWDAIATGIKVEVNWCCEFCGRACIRRVRWLGQNPDGSLGVELTLLIRDGGATVPGQLDGMPGELTSRAILNSREIQVIEQRMELAAEQRQYTESR